MHTIIVCVLRLKNKKIEAFIMLQYMLMYTGLIYTGLWHLVYTRAWNNGSSFSKNFSSVRVVCLMTLLVPQEGLYL